MLKKTFLTPSVGFKFDDVSNAYKMVFLQTFYLWDEISFASPRYTCAALYNLSTNSCKSYNSKLILYRTEGTSYNNTYLKGVCY